VVGGILVGVSIFVIGYDIDDENEEIMLLFLSLFYHYRLCSYFLTLGANLQSFYMSHDAHASIGHRI
jgi:hypothetical protein